MADSWAGRRLRQEATRSPLRFLRGMDMSVVVTGWGDVSASVSRERRWEAPGGTMTR